MDEYEGWRELRNAIIEQALSDWHSLVTKRMTAKPNINCVELVDFFKSKWCEDLLVDLPVSGEDLLNVLQGYKHMGLENAPAPDRMKQVGDTKLMFYNGWNRDKIKYFIRAHVDMKKETFTGEFGSG